MPTARDLLDQADALMRRNRKHGRGKQDGPPTLTEALGVDRRTELAPTLILPETAAEADPIALDALADLPLLTDVIDVGPAAAQAVTWPPGAGSELTDALDDALQAAALAGVVGAFDDGDDADATLVPIAGSGEATEAEGAPALASAAADDAPETEGVPPLPAIAVADDVPPAVLPAPTDARPDAREPSAALEPIDEEFILEIPPAAEADRPAGGRSDTAPPAIVAAAPVLAPGSREWDALAEEIRMQVLQRLDLFTDTGMRDQLGARLRPIVDRASAELVEAINHALGELVRGYVAEAIEREIESWRKRSG
jgi:hypothetical protein